VNRLGSEGQGGDQADERGPVAAVSPDGVAIYDIKTLGMFDSPFDVRVSRGVLYIDGWAISFRPLSKDAMIWLQRQFNHWRESDPGPENHVQLLGLLDALETMVKECQN